MKTFEQFGIKIPKILLPKKLDTETWATVACDQYTQDREYWKKAEECAKSKPSTLNLILPEVYLNDKDKNEKILKIRKNMQTYLDEGIFEPEKEEFIYIERTTSHGRTRKGLIVAIDLEKYEWKPFSTALIRATEATIVERIPPTKPPICAETSIPGTIKPIPKFNIISGINCVFKTLPKYIL